MDVYDTIEAMQKDLHYPKYPTEHEGLPSHPTKEEIDEYLKYKDLPLDKKLEEYEKKVKLIRAQEQEIYEFIKQEGGLYDIPEQYQKKVWSKALEKDSYFEIYQELEELTGLFF